MQYQHLRYVTTVYSLWIKNKNKIKLTLMLCFSPTALDEIAIIGIVVAEDTEVPPKEGKWVALQGSGGARAPTWQLPLTWAPHSPLWLNPSTPHGGGGHQIWHAEFTFHRLASYGS